jgi:hypothetical protein
MTLEHNNTLYRAVMLIDIIVTLNVIKLIVILLNVVMLSVVAPI